MHCGDSGPQSFYPWTALPNDTFLSPVKYGFSPSIEETLSIANLTAVQQGAQ
jgi:hypothetical protein